MKTLIRPAARYIRENHCSLYYRVEKAWQWTENLKRLRYPVIDATVPLLEYARQAGWPVTLHAPAQLVERAPSHGISEDMEVIGRHWRHVTNEGSNSAMYISQLRSRVRYPVEASFTTRIPEAHVSPRGDVLINDDGTPLRVRSWTNSPHCEGIDEAEIVEGPVVSLLSVFATSFSHWLFDSLLRVALLPEETRMQVRFLVPGKRRKFVDDYLDFFGIREDQRIYTSSWVFCEELIQVETTHRSNMPHPAALAAFRSYFGIREKPGNTRIFIGRRSRKLLNEDHVFAVASRFGFKRYFLEDLSLSEQVSLFHDAEFITGYHGAGFANMIYAAPGAKVIEILNPAKWDHAYIRVANQLGLEHWHLLVNYRPHTWDASVDINHWEKILRLATNATGAADAVY